MRLIAFIFLGLVTIAFAADDRCSPPPDVDAFIDSLPAVPKLRREVIDVRLKATPDDIWLNRLWVDATVYEPVADRNRYSKLLARHPDNLDYQYIQARSLVGSDTKEALKRYAQILEKDPDYPWVHISQLEIYGSEAFRDRAKLAESIAAVQRACPSSFRPYSYMNGVSSDEVAANAAVKLRGLLSGTAKPRDLRLYSTLWALEFRVRPVAEHDEERKQVSEDLKRLLPLESDTALRSVIENGAKLTQDKALEQRMAALRKPEPLQSLVRQSNAWLHEHPRPKSDATPDVRHAYGKDLAVKIEEWNRLAPGQASIAIDRARALIYQDAPPEEIARAGEAAVAILRSDSGSQATWLTALATLYLESGVLLDRVEPLCEEAMARMDDPEAVIEIDLAPSPHNAANRQMLVRFHVDALLLIAQLHEKRGDKDKAHALLWRAADYLAAKAPAAGETNHEILNWQTLARYALLRTTAEMAEREGRKLDALNGYREALAMRPIGGIELTARQRALWKELGGTDEGWQQWQNPIHSADPAKTPGAAPAQPGQSAEKRKLSPLSARDTNGGEWTLDRFAGKTVIAVVWATWCEPCRAELPYFAKLADRVKDRSDALAVSFNTDDNIASAEAFAKSNGYKFPVISMKQYAEDLMPSFAIPRTWIIKDGVIAKEFVGFGRDGDKWVEQMVAALP